MIRPALLALLLLAAFPIAPRAQVAEGMRVRVQAPALSREWIRGTVVGVDSAALRLRVPPGDATLLVPAETMQRLQASRGRGTATLEGAIAGGTLAALVGFFAVQAEGDTGCVRGCGGASGGGFLVGAAAGTLLGALIGSHVRTGPERWREVPLPPR